MGAVLEVNPSWPTSSCHATVKIPFLKLIHHSVQKVADSFDRNDELLFAKICWFSGDFGRRGRL